MTRSPDIQIDFLNRLRQLTVNRCPHMPENAVLSKFVQPVQLDADFQKTLSVSSTSGIFFIHSGMVGVFHEFEGQKRLSHTYDKCDIFFSNEVLLELNKQRTFWRVFSDAEVLFLNLGDPRIRQEFPMWLPDIQMFISLYSTYQYQDYINAMGLDRKAFSIQWLKDHPNTLSFIPRSDLAAMLNISMTSLKSFIKTVLYGE